MRRRVAARRTDPATSAWAAWQIEKSGKAGSQRRQVYLTMIGQGRVSLTAGEIAQAGIHDRYMVSRRLPELEELNLVRRGDPRLCRVMESKQTTWRVVCL